MNRKLLSLSFASACGLAVFCPGQLRWSEYPAPLGGGGVRIVYDSARQCAVGIRTATNSMEVLESDGGPWRLIPTPPMAPQRRDSAALAFDGASGRTLLFGGVVNGVPLGDTWSWDGATWARHGGGGPDPRGGAAMAYDVRRQRVVLHGGVADGAATRTDTWEWDGAAWREIPVVGPSGRVGHQMVYDAQRAAVVMCGGYRGPAATAFDVWSFDGSGWSMVAASQGPSARSDFGLGFDPRTGRIVVHGGVVPSRLGASVSTETWTLDGATWTRRSAAAPLLRAFHALAFDESLQRVILFGGSSGPVTWVWTGDDWTSDPRRSAPLATFGKRMVWDSWRERTLLFGRVPHDRFDLWSRTADGWDLIPGDPTAVASGLRSSRSGGFAFDADRGVAVVFGGTVSPFTGVAEFDGTRWRRVPVPAPEPGFRSDMLFVHDAARGGIVLFGGDRGFALGDTWIWDGTSFEQRFPATSPTPRHSMAACYDASRERVVMFGGNGSAAAETWEWDGSDWTQRFPATTPPGRAGASMVYDTARRRAVLVGGDVADSRVWEYDGQDWTPRTTVPGLPSRTDFAAVYDPARGVTVVHDGVDPTSRLAIGDTWELAPVDPATTRNFGAGCAGRVFRLRADSLPWAGEALDIRAVGFAPDTSVRVWIGFSDTVWSGGALPAALDRIGMRGCELAVSLDVEFPMQRGAEASLSIPIPNDPVLVGGEFFLQAYGPAPGANPVGVGATDALAASIGGL